MGTDIHILVEFYDQEKKCWVLMKLNQETQKYEPFSVEKLEQIPGETDEKFEEREEEWHYNLPGESVRRDYKLFAEIANVRNEDDIVPWSLPKRFPYDVSQDAILASGYNYPENSNGHSYTWYTTLELQMLIMFNEGELIEIVNRAHEQCPLSRLLFWFDN